MPARNSSIASAHGQMLNPAPRVDGGELNIIGVARRFSRDQLIYGEGDRADVVYKVISGAVRVSRLLSDGRRQVQAFHLPGGVFGWELRPERHAAAEALGDCMIVTAPHASLADPTQAARLCRHALGELQRAQDHLLTLGRRTALERLASFIVDLAERLGEGEDIRLPMSRQDIADYLGLTIETVSRTLTQMQARRLVRVRGSRQLRILARDALVAICE
jgi:CRP/FNR family transcriptional regulator, nitrogen fixation regulation protein